MLCKIPNKTLLTVYEYGVNWCRTIYNGTEGWVQTKYLVYIGGDLSKAKATVVSDDARSLTEDTDWAPMVSSAEANSGANSEAITEANESSNTQSNAAPTPTPAPSSYNPKRDKTLQDTEVFEARVHVSWGRLNMRAGCHKKADLIVKIDGDESVTVLQVGKEWCLVRWKEYTGYVMSEYLLLPEEYQ